MNSKTNIKRKFLKHQHAAIKKLHNKSDLPGADLRFMDLRRLNLRDINLSGSDLSFSDIRDTDFSYSNLRGVNLSNCKMQGANFNYSDCTCVDFSGSDFDKASFTGAISERDDLASDTLSARPLISIYMPTWNREKLTIRAIYSVLKQDYEHWELIIVDDFSSSFKLLQKFISDLNDPRIIYIRNEYNSGACAVRNQAIRLAKGDFITGLDDDDEWLSSRLSSFLSYRYKLNYHGFLYAGDYLCESASYDSIDDLKIYPKPNYKKSLFDKKNVIGNQVFTVTSRMQKVLFDTELTAAQDYDAFYRLAEVYGSPFKLENITQILYVNHGEVRITCSSRKFSGYLNFYRKHKSKFDTSSVKYQLFTLYYIRNKKMSLKTLMRLMTVRNFKRYFMMYSNFRKRKF